MLDFMRKKTELYKFKYDKVCGYCNKNPIPLFFTP